MATSEQATSKRRSGPVGPLFVAGLIVFLLVIAFRQINHLQQQLDRIADQNIERAFYRLCDQSASPSTRTECFLQLVNAGHQNWASASLSNLKLADCSLKEVSLTNAHFDSCEMRHLDLQDSDLRASKFDVCDLSEANFRDADARETSFFKADLSKADFRGARLMSSSFEQATAKSAILVASKIDDGFLPMAVLDGSDLTGANLSDCVLEATSLRDCTLSLTNFKNADITDADFSGSNWWRARGFSNEQRQYLLVNFAPENNAQNPRSRDFDLWLNSIDSQ